MVVFIVAALVTRTINRADLINLQEIANGLGPLRKIVQYALTVIEKFMKILQPENKDA